MSSESINLSLKWVHIAIYLIAYTLINIISGALGWQLQTTIIVATTFLLLELIVIVKRHPFWVTFVILSPFYVLYISSTLIGKDVESITALVWLAGLVSILIFVFLRFLRIPILYRYIIYLLCLFFVYAFLWPNTESYLSIEENDKYSLSDVQIVNEKNEGVSLESLKGKVVVFDFWHSKCGVCFRKFPEFQALYNQFKNNSKVVIVALNIPLDTDKGVYRSDLIEAYSFHKWYLKNPAEAEKIPIRYAPLIMVLDENGKIHHVGQLHTEWNIVIGNTQNIIQKLLKK